MIKTTRWHPDTCDCIIDYTWDDTTSEDNRVLTFSSIISSCVAHKDLADKDCYTAVSSENSSKNTAVNTVAQAYPNIAPEDVAFSYDDKRVLTVSAPGLTADQITTALIAPLKV